MPNEREKIFNLHNIVVKHKDKINTTYSPLNNEQSPQNNDTLKNVSYGDLAKLISSKDTTNGNT